MLHPYLSPWQLDVTEIQLEALQHRLRVSNQFELYLKTHFQTVVTTIINEGKMKNAKSSKAASNTPLVWVNTQLTAEHVSQFLETVPSDAEILNGLLALVGEGFELTYKHDSSAKCWRAYLFDKTEGQATHFGLSCFADTPRDTLNLLLFKFYVVLDGSFPDPDLEVSKPKFG